MRFYCDFCKAFLAHDSQRARREHNYGWKHREKVEEYFANIYAQKFEEAKNQYAQQLALYQQQVFALQMAGRPASEFPLPPRPPTMLIFDPDSTSLFMNQMAYDEQGSNEDDQIAEAAKTLDYGKSIWLPKSSYQGPGHREHQQ